MKTVSIENRKSKHKSIILKIFPFVISGFILLACIHCSSVGEKEFSQKHQTRIDSLIQNLEDSQNEQIIVVAHRGDWINAPENSLQGIQNCIDMRVDMVEIDVRKTIDGQLILMHDKTINRTTNSTGLVEELFFDSIMTIRLKDRHGNITSHKIPTLEEALVLAKGKILINLDKCYNIWEECYEVIIRTNTTLPS